MIILYTNRQPLKKVAPNSNRWKGSNEVDCAKFQPMESVYKTLLIFC
uniref:Uncharacterized protein n=1 Tax=viral metagenome TaxID=1070528 RepID=A0A6C0IKD1_9ZZZZ